MAASAFARANTVPFSALLAWIIHNNAREPLDDPRSRLDFVERATIAEELVAAGADAELARGIAVKRRAVEKRVQDLENEWEALEAAVG